MVVVVVGGGDDGSRRRSVEKKRKKRKKKMKKMLLFRTNRLSLELVSRVLFCGCGGMLRSVTPSVRD